MYAMYCLQLSEGKHSKSSVVNIINSLMGTLTEGSETITVNQYIQR